MFYVDGTDERKSNWMRFINMPRKETEENLKSFQYRGQVYYRTYKPIQPGTELLEFYGYEHAMIFGIDMDKYFSGDDDLLTLTLTTMILRQYQILVGSS